MKRLRHPVRAIREPFGKAGLIVAACAVLLALSGGAYAAGKLTGKEKKEVEKIAKKFAGKPGAPGAQGPAGQAGSSGAKGDAGSAGAPGQNGAPGASGKTVLNGNGAPGAGIGTVGDFYIDTSSQEIYGPKASSGVNGGWGEPTALKGAQGDPWTAGGTLPANATETGTWAFGSTQAATPEGLAGQKNQLVPISFPIPLSGTLEKSHAIYVPAADTTTEHCSAAPINGSVADPKAESGYLCVYEASTTNADPQSAIPFIGAFFPPGGAALGANTSGTTLILTVPDPGDTSGSGSWAVTG
jgi:hypothetical protein